MARVIEHSATATTTGPESRPELKREMGLWAANAMIVGNMIGSGLFVLPDPPVSALASPAHQAPSGYRVRRVAAAALGDASFPGAAVRVRG